MAGVTVLQLSDTHFTESPAGTVKDRDPSDRLDRVLAAWDATGLRADLVVLTGDNADDGSLGACQRLADSVRRFGAPVLAVPGNHDLAEPVAAVFGAVGSVEVGVWRMIGLSSEIAGHIEGALDVAETLAALDGLDARPTVLAIHHPPVGTSRHPWFQLDGADALLAGLAERPHVRAVISGHLHEAFEFGAANGMALLGAPSTLYAIRHQGDQWAGAADGVTGGRVLRLDDDGSLSWELLRA